MPTLDELKYRLYKSLPGQVQDKLPEQLQAADPHALRNKLLATGAAGLAGLGGYKYFRHARFASDPVLRRLQQRAAKGGFKQFVEVSRKGTTPGLKQKPLNLVTPRLDGQGNLNAWNKLKLKLLAGDSAIPVSTSGKLLGNKDLGALTYGFTAQPTSTQRLYSRAARNKTHFIEGDAKSLRATASIEERGKGFEADLLRSLGEDTIAKSITRFPRSFRTSLQGKKITGAHAKALQEKMRQLAAKRGIVGESMLKPVDGISSGGRFPRMTDDWGHLYDEFEKHRLKSKRLQRLMAEGGNDLADYLKSVRVGKKSLYEGYTVSQAMRNPKNVMLQEFIPNMKGELRVHAMRGHVPQNLIMNRTSMRAPHDPVALRRFVQSKLNRLPAKYRQGSYAFDVASFKHPRTGKLNYRIIEMNPYAHSSSAAGASTSGLLDASTTPYGPSKLYKTYTGRDTQAVAGLKALGTAGVAGAGTYAGAKLTDGQ